MSTHLAERAKMSQIFCWVAGRWVQGTQGTPFNASPLVGGSRSLGLWLQGPVGPGTRVSPLVGKTVS